MPCTCGSGAAVPVLTQAPMAHMCLLCMQDVVTDFHKLKHVSNPGCITLAAAQCTRSSGLCSCAMLAYACTLHNGHPQVCKNGASESLMTTCHRRALLLRAQRDAHRLTRKNEDMRPFEAGGEQLLEHLARRADAGLFVLDTHNKKRPHNLVLGRLFDHRLYDLVGVPCSPELLPACLPACMPIIICVTPSARCSAS